MIPVSRPVGYSSTDESVNRRDSTPLNADRGGQHLLPTIQGLDWEGDGDLYRQRLQALKHEVGSNWLTVLGDQPWDPRQRNINVHDPGLCFGSSPTIRPDSLTRTRSQIIVSGGGALE
jgi:hypothetical protein